MSAHDTLALWRSGAAVGFMLLFCSLAACGAPADVEPETPEWETDHAAMTGDVRIDGDPNFCYWTDDGHWACDDGVISKAESVNTLQGIIGATAHLFGPDGNCSSTLVTRRHVLTARHCITSKDGTRYSVRFPQDPRSFRGKRFEYLGDYSTYSRHWAGNDIALLELDTPVPLDVVGNVAPVWMRGIDDALRHNPKFAVGFGAPNGGKRQYGRVNGARREFDPCDNGWAEGSCQPTAIIRADDGDAVAAQPGDSGGPLFVKIDGTYYVVGVLAYYGIWAPVGKPTLINDRIDDLADVDLDNDGIDDIVDNCPPSACSSPFACYNPGQEDDDDDGVGEACDNCPASACAASGLDCRNPSQLDFDRDRIGDMCDLCPEVASNDNRDADGDLVGDACEVCTTASEVKSCTEDALCSRADAGYCIMDKFPDQAERLGGRCSKLPDDDRDGIPDECDDCSTHKDFTNANANRAIELELKVAPRGDRCDPVPHLDVEPIRPEVLMISQGAGEPGMDTVGMDATRILTTDGTLQIHNVDQEVDGRHCGCYGAGGTKLDEAVCLQDEECVPSKARREQGRWKQVSFEVDGAATSPTTVNFKAQPAFPAQPQLFLEWMWLEDARRPLNPIEKRTDASGFVTTHGLFATVVEQPEDFSVSPRDSTSFLRTVARLIPTPYVTKYRPNFDLVAGPCTFPHCLGYLPSMRHIYEPSDWLWGIASPAPLIASNGVATMLRKDVAMDVSEWLDPPLMEMLESGDWVLLPTMERGDALAAFDVRPVGALVPRQGAGFAQPIRVIAEEGMVRLADTPLPDAGDSYAVLPDLGRAIYSGRQDAVYFIGGEEGTVYASLRRFSFADGETYVFGDVAAVEGEVAGMAVDPLRQRAYVLFLDRGDEQSAARIAWIDLGSGRSGDLLQVPYGPENHRAALSLGPQGELLLLADDAEGVVGWMFEVQGEGADLELESIGAWRGEGALLDAPHPSHPTVVVTDGMQAKVHELRASDFNQSVDLTGL